MEVAASSNQVVEVVVEYFPLIPASEVREEAACHPSILAKVEVAVYHCLTVTRERYLRTVPWCCLPCHHPPRRRNGRETLVYLRSVHFTFVIIVSKAFVSFSRVCSKCSMRPLIKLIWISFSAAATWLPICVGICDRSCIEPVRIDGVCSWRPKAESLMDSQSIE